MKDAQRIYADQVRSSGSISEGHQREAEKARQAGRKFCLVNNVVLRADTGSKIGENRDIQVKLAVPYSEREDAKGMGCKWDPDLKIWHIAIHKAWENAFKWTREEDRIYLTTPIECRQLAVGRGAALDQHGNCFVPSWHMLESNIYELIRRVCYWLPITHPEFQVFRSTQEAAQWLQLNGGYMPVECYLPEEAAYLNSRIGLKGESSLYLCGEGKAQYFRLRLWDSF